MLTVVVVINTLIALVCLYVAWQVWSLSRVLKQVTETLLIAERSTHNILYGAPEAIAQGEIGVHQLRQQYQNLQPQLQRLNQILSLLSWGRTAWRRQRVMKVMRKQGARLSSRGR